jgi:uncharacterized protein
VLERPMKQLLEEIARAVVDNPQAVTVRSVESSQVTVFELRTDPTDLGKVIGRDGRMAKAIRTILRAAGAKLQKRFLLEIMDEHDSVNGQAERS